MHYIERDTRSIILKGMENMPAIFINGPRQAGKSTLVYRIAREDIHADYISLDDLSALSLAKSNPSVFLDNFRKPLVIDEVQMAPELFIHLKQYIDNSRLSGENPNGKFLLTGSSGIHVIPQLAESLVGRMLLVTLYPFSAGEIFLSKGNFTEAIFGESVIPDGSSTKPFNLSQIIEKVTFPQLSTDPSVNTDTWFSSYIQMLVNRDIRNIVSIEKAYEIPLLLKMLATRVGGIVNDADLARSTNLNHMTLRRYKSLVENVFLIFTVPPWYGNIGKRLVKAPKIYFTDTFLLAYLSGYKLSTLLRNEVSIWGKFVENFVATELMKQLAITRMGNLFYFRTLDHKEVDFIIEKRDGELVGIEVKNSSLVGPDDFSGLRLLKNTLGEKFKSGIVLYNGNRIIMFDKNLIAMPISSLWMPLKMGIN